MPRPVRMGGAVYAPTIPGWRPEEQHERRQLLRYLMRAKNWELSPSARQQKCGRCRREADVSIGQAPYQDKDGATRYGPKLGGLVTCGSVHACPVCAPAIMARRRTELADAEAEAKRRGWGVMHVTVTGRHHVHTDSRGLLGAMSTAWSHARSGAPWQRWKRRIGFRGTVRALDATIGANGLHAHYHVAVFTDRRISDDDMEDLRAFWFSRYRSKLVQLGYEAPLERKADGSALGIDVRRGDDGQALAEYLTKHPLAWELTGADTKGGREDGSRTMWEVLRDAAIIGRTSDAEAWRGWCEATAGRNALVWSKGLRAELLGDAALPEDDAELLDQDDAAAAPSTVHVATVPGAVWDLVGWVPTVSWALCKAAETGPDAVDAVLRMALARVKPPPGRVDAYRKLQRHQARANMGEWLRGAGSDDHAAVMELGALGDGAAALAKHARTNVLPAIVRAEDGRPLLLHTHQGTVDVQDVRRPRTGLDRMD